MQLDQTRILIRERGFLEILDLALRVMRTHAGPLALAFVCGVAPAMCLNAWLLADFTEPDFELGFPAMYLWYMLLLVIWEAPLATALVTLYLGRALFTGRPLAGEIIRNFIGSLLQMFWYQVLLRALLVPWVVTWVLPYALWPYLSEVVLLERNPFGGGSRGKMTTGRRRAALHNGYVAELFARWLAAAVIGLLLFASFWLSLWFGGGLLLSEWDWEGLTYTLYFPLAMWLVAGYFTVVRFLGYLDLRIRREGWEVELMMRAEGARLSRQLA